MKVYSLGNKAGPTLMLLPGTCCHWKSNFAPVLPLLEPHFHVLCVSYDGFDETEPDTTFPTMEEEAAKIEAYINENLGGHLHAAYGCSLGGSFVGLPLIYPVVRDGRFKSKLLNKKMEKRKQEMPGYVDKFMEIMGGARPYVSMQSCKNQFYSDMITPLPDHWDGPTAIHIFYALKMGEKYRARYAQHYAHPIIHEQDMQHEELLACHPEQWAALVKEICL